MRMLVVGASGFLGGQVCRRGVAAGWRVAGTWHTHPVEIPGVATYAGLLNVAGPEAVSRAELGVLVARRFGLDPAGLRTTTIAEAGLVRPADVRLDSSRAAGLLRTRPRGITELLTS
ncbi:hypothetical protein [Micromonospora sp. KC723]|uniref:hypothetical protein n=1 Tax=Micromonospora sp. KC723 TaxID=2530381 RepID=UPI001046CD2E|nr:hypothetical protein [Micromonospora sp. KC723]TDB77721.1 hypothetical protein E1165_03215 [Micromonospora sp. KC723]